MTSRSPGPWGGSQSCPVCLLTWISSSCGREDHFFNLSFSPRCFISKEKTNVILLPWLDGQGNNCCQDGDKNDAEHSGNNGTCEEKMYDELKVWIWRTKQIRGIGRRCVYWPTFVSGSGSSGSSSPAGPPEIVDTNVFKKHQKNYCSVSLSAR